MSVKWQRFAVTAAMGIWAMGACAAARAQAMPGSGQTPPASTPGGQQTPAQTPAPASGDASKGSAPVEVAPPVNAEEDAAFKAFQDASSADATKKIAMGEAFVQKYPASRYLPILYSQLTMLYLQTNQVQKMEDVGDKEVKLTPTDVQTLAILGQTIPRAMNGSVSGADQQKELAKAEDYSKRAIELTPTITKPANLTDEQFASAKNVTLAMAHSGLGLIYVRRGKYADAIPELDQSVKLDPTPDPVNYYLLGLANEKASHFPDAVAAYNKCAGLPSSMADTCKTKAAESKKLGDTQLSIPK
jgi:tetratricopeptide (TPR) repeat protein